MSRILLDIEGLVRYTVNMNTEKQVKRCCNSICLKYNFVIPPKRMYGYFGITDEFVKYHTNYCKRYRDGIELGEECADFVDFDNPPVYNIQISDSSPTTSDGIMRVVGKPIAPLKGDEPFIELKITKRGETTR